MNVEFTDEEIEYLIGVLDRALDRAVWPMVVMTRNGAVDLRARMIEALRKSLKSDK